MEKEKINEITNLLEDTFNERNVNVQLLLDSLLTEDDYDPEFEGLTPFRITYEAVESTCILLEQIDSLDKLDALIIQRKELLNLDRYEFYNNTGEKIVEKLSLKPLIIEVSDEIEKLEARQRTGRLTNKKDDSYDNDRALESSKVIREAIDLYRQIKTAMKLERSSEKLRDLIHGKCLLSLSKSDLMEELEKGRIPEFHEKTINDLIACAKKTEREIDSDIELMKNYKDLEVLDEDDDENDKENTSEDLKPTLKTKFDDIDKLKDFHSRLKQYIKCDLDSWMYWFGGFPTDKPKQIEFLKSIPELLYFMEILCPDDFKVGNRKIKELNHIFKPVKGKKIDSVHSSTKVYDKKSAIEKLFR